MWKAYFLFSALAAVLSVASAIPVSELSMSNGIRSEDLSAALALSQIQDRATCSGPTPSAPQTFWREKIAHNGIAATIGSTTYNVWRNVVTAWSADNTGAKDASVAINNAIAAQSRAGTFTTRPAYIYVPGGTYLIKSSIQMLVNTYLVGDPLHMPTFVADPSLGTNPVIQGFDSHQQSTTNFYTGIRNINIDTTRIQTTTTAVGLNWAVSQACSLFNVNFNMPDSSSHIGITMIANPGGNDNEGGGSGTIISDCSFTGGAIGVKISNQQYNLKGLSFDGCNVGISVQSLFVGTFQDITVQHCNYGIDLSASGSVGGISIIDSSVSTCQAGVYTAVTGNGEGSLILDNFSVGSGVIAVKSTNGNTLLAGTVAPGQTWVLGNENPQNYQGGTKYQINRPAALLSGSSYFTMKQPQYEQYDVSEFVNVKSVAGQTVYGDNQHDDANAINAILAANANCKITYFPQGIYKVQSTILIPPGSRIVGDVLSVISGVGAMFYNPLAPNPVVQIGNVNDVGVAQITDMMFTVGDVLQGATILKINMAGNNPGDVGLWNSHIRVGGTQDSLVNTNCAGGDTSDCKAAFALMHVTPSGSAYIENMWGWTADHSLDGGPNQNIATGRGALIQSTKGLWMVGTAFEHNTLYQYKLDSAKNVYIGMQQTETPYWQGNGSPQLAPAPWTPLTTGYNDPTFSNCGASDAQCRMAYAMTIDNSSSIVIHGSAFWVFFNGMNDGAWANVNCPSNGGICQTTMANINSNTGLFWYNIGTKQVKNMISDNGVITAPQNHNPGGWGGALAAYLKDSGIASEQ